MLSGTKRIEIASLERGVSSPSPDDLGLRPAQARELLLRLQSVLAQDPVRQVSTVDRTRRCGSSRRLHDYRTRQVDTLLGRVILRQPRWRSCGCDRIEPQPNADHARGQSRTSALIGGRATPELMRVQAELGARSSFRQAARVMSVLPPAGKAANHTGIRRRLARTADLLQVLDNASPHRMSRVEGDPMVVALDGAYIRAVFRISGAPLRSHGRACGNQATASPALRRCSERGGVKVRRHWQRPEIKRMAAGSRRHPC